MTTKEELQTRIAKLKAALSQAEAIEEISQSLNTAHNKDELFQVLCRPALEAGATRMTLTYIDLDDAGEPEWVEIVAVWQRQGPPPMPVGARFYVPEFPLVNLWMSNPDETLLAADVTTDERVDENTRHIMSQMDVRTLVVIPLVQAGRWVGLFSFGWAEPHEFSEQETAIYRAMARLASPSVENRRLVDSLEKMVEERTGELVRVLDNIRDSVISTDLAGTITSWNRASEHIFGWTAEEAIGKNIGILYREQDMPILAEEVITPTMEQGYQEGEYQALRKDGTEFTERLATSLVLDDKGDPSGMVGIVADVTEQKQAKSEQERLQQEIIETQRRAIQELSTPVIPIMDRIIVMPLVGSIDTMRARDITRSLLAGISEQRAKVVIMDITGVSVVDSGVANHLNKTIQAARLKGARTIITGISDAVAETIVDLGIDWSGIDTLNDLRTGLIVALDSMGIKLAK